MKEIGGKKKEKLKITYGQHSVSKQLVNIRLSVFNGNANGKEALAWGVILQEVSSGAGGHISIFIPPESL